MCELIFGKKLSFYGGLYLKHFKALKASIKSLIKNILQSFKSLCKLKMRAFNWAQLRITDTSIAENRYLNLAETCYKTCNLLFDPNVFFYFAKLAETLFRKVRYKECLLISLIVCI